MSNDSKNEILGAIAGVSKAVVELSIEMNRKHEEIMSEMNRRFDENDRQHKEIIDEMNRRFEENDRQHKEMMEEMNKRFDKNDEDHKFMNLAIDTLGILSKENDIDHTEYNKKLDIKRVKFSTQ